MRSISIVYRTPRKQISPDKLFESLKIKRNLDQYYQKLAQKYNTKQIQSPTRTTTSRCIRIRDKHQIASTLNIHRINNQSPVPFKQNQKPQTLKRSFTIKKTMNNFFSFKTPEHNNFLYQNHTKDSSKNCKLKALLPLNPAKKRDTVIVISVDFILNQFNFWEEEQIQQGSIRAWRMIQNIASVIWLVRRESSLKKLTTFIKQNNLNQDGIYKVLPKKNGKTLCVSYALMQKQLKLQNDNKLIVVNGLRVQNIQQLHYSLFYSLIPHIRHSSSFVHFIQLDINEKNRLNNVLKILSRSLPDSITLNYFFREFIKNQKQAKKIKTQKERQYYDNQRLLERIEVLKKEFNSFFQQRFIKSDSQNRQSIHFLIGDMLRRNYKTLSTIYNYKRPIKTQDKSNNNHQQIFNDKIYYNRPAYIWRF